MYSIANKLFKNKPKTIFLFLMSLCIATTTLLGATSQINANNKSQGKDVTPLITINSVDILIDFGSSGGFVPVIVDGILQENLPPIYVGYGIQLNYTWSVSDASTIQEGDYFLIDLPQSYYSFSNTGTFPLMDESTQIGTYQIQNKQLITTFNHNIEGKNSLQQGFFTAYGMIVQSGTIDSSTGGLSLPPLLIQPKPPQNPTPEDTMEMPNYGSLTKQGNQVAGDNKILWHILVNYDNAKKVYQGLTPTPMNHVILEDNLPPNMIMEEDTFEIASPIYKPTSEAKMSSISLSWRTATSAFQKVMATAGESYESFRGRIVHASVPTYGIYNGRQLVVNFLDLPNGGSGIRLPSLSNDAQLQSMLNLKQSQGFISAVQNSIIYDAYASTNTAHGDVINFNVNFNTIILGDSGSYQNNANLIYNDTQEVSSVQSVQFTKIYGGATTTLPGTLTLTKTDDDGELLQGMSFKLQKKASNGDYIDYLSLDGGTLVRQTNAAGVVEFAKLVVGDYKVIETDADTGYTTSPTYSPSNEFSITSAQTTGIQLSAVNHLQLGSVALIKTNEASTPLAGAKFHLYKDADGVLMYYTGLDDDHASTWSKNPLDAQIFTTPANGSILADGLTIGTYFFVETLAPEGYQLDDTPVELQVTKALLTYGSVDTKTAINQVLPSSTTPFETGSIQLIKTTSSGVPLAKASFHLYKIQGSTLYYYTGLGLDQEALWSKDKKNAYLFLSNAQGIVAASGLVEGSYYFVEQSAPLGYQCNATPVRIDLSELNVLFHTTASEHMVNLKLGSVVLTKLDKKSSKTLAHATYSLYNSKDEVVSEHLKTNPFGQFSVNNLSPGDYYFVETSAPIGYLLDATPITFRIFEDDENTQQVLAYNIQFTNNVLVEQPKIDQLPTKPSPINEVEKIRISTSSYSKQQLTQSVKTNDSNSLTLWIVALVGSSMILGFVLRVSKKQR